MPKLTTRRKTLILAICCMSLLIVGMDGTIVNVALPSIRRDLGADVSGLQWVIDAYTLTLASFLILSGSTADRIGRRRTFQIGLASFTVGSALCSVAPNLQLLIIARIVQALGGSMLNPVAMSIITNVFTERRERAKAIGIWGGVVGISMGLGPVIGGVLIETIGWRWIFWINVPIGIAAIVLAKLFVPESKAARARRVDPVGQVLVIVVLASLTYAIVESSRLHWHSVEVWSILALSLAALLVLVAYEPRRADPLIDLRFFSSAPFSGATVIAISAFGGYAGFLFLNSLYLQDVRGFSALQAGLTVLPMAVMTMVFAPLSGRLVAAGRVRFALMGAGVAMAVAGTGLTVMTSSTPLGYLIGCYVLFAIGFGLVNAPITNTAVSGMPISQAGVAAAIASTSRQIGATLGVAVIGSVLAAGTISAGSKGHPAGQAAGILESAATAWWIVAGCGLSVLLLGLLTTGSWARSTAGRAAELMKAEELSVPEPAAR
ncbi:MFS transporter [Nakamurella sp. PAMC28650]|uniref:MFS transporter n=1 Tax=Nakamurella sp. PAMC28650 TaxID=2762325 RepID=UPI00164CF1A8|nr:MFS transporter [Nakamurella sp. PAMC28650]QNK80165.1 MFS transporter [Nakamurella sp. PAMC28650]